MRFALLLALAFGVSAPALAIEKGGMPDLAQIDNTCLPTSAANLMIWFGRHGYPKLLQPGATTDESSNHIVHLLMADTGARYDVGTEMEAVTHGLEAYVHRAGYACSVEYRGLDGRNPFTQDWLQENDDPNKGFVLLLTYCHYHSQSDTFSEAWNAGHAVTLVNAEPDLLLIHDPAHDETETGRKIITPRLLTRGTFEDDGSPVPVAGLLMLSGSLLEAPPDSEVMLTGAVCITLHQAGSASPAPATGPNARLAGPARESSSPISANASAASAGWWNWVLTLVLGR
jgi:hypothetical protein